MIRSSGQDAARLDLDKIGATASVTCAIHCAVMPMVITFLPLLGLGFLSSEGVEWGLLAASAVIGITSLCLGIRKHGRRRPLAILGPGLGLVVLGRIAEEHAKLGIGVPLVVVGGFTIAASHWINRRLCHACPVCEHSDSTAVGPSHPRDASSGG